MVLLHLDSEFYIGRTYEYFLTPAVNYLSKSNRMLNLLTCRLQADSMLPFKVPELSGGRASHALHFSSSAMLCY
jgi:hypothetical protein